jgi:DNA-binding NtrC family response regulator
MICHGTALFESSVLLVDDSETILETLKETLQHLGVPGEKIFVATNPKDALKIFLGQRPPVVFMDLDLDGASGDAAAIKILKAAPSTKLIVMSGYDRHDPRVRDLVSAGAYEFLEKPLRVARLQQLMQLIDSEEKGLRRVS